MSVRIGVLDYSCDCVYYLSMTKVISVYTAAGAVTGLVYFAVVVLCGFGDLSGFVWKAFFYSVVLTPLLEEYLFRGVLQAHLANKYCMRFGVFSVANILASLIFALSHLAYSDPLHAAAVFLPSLLFGYFYEKTGSLIPPIVTHAVFNLNVFVVYRSDILSKIF